MALWPIGPCYGREKITASRLQQEVIAMSEPQKKSVSEQLSELIALSEKNLMRINPMLEEISVFRSDLAVPRPHHQRPRDD